MNDSPYGLTASVWSADLDAVASLGARIETGTVFANRCDYLDPALVWTGVKETHFRRCAVRARENSLPGVTVLAVGAVRAEIVLQCVKRGLVNYLVLDSDCAEKLASLV